MDSSEWIPVSVRLSPEQNKVWEYALAFYLNEGRSDSEADVLAHRDLLLEFPALAKGGEFRLREDIRTALPKMPANWYQTIYADPPWDESGGGKICRGAQGHYGLMKQKDLLALSSQVKRVTAPAAHLYLWVTNTFLEDGLELARGWGFEYKTTITWVKDGKPGIGQYFRGQSEQCIFAVKGVLPYKILRDANGVPILSDKGKEQRLQGRTAFTAPRMEHSAKPLEMRTMIEKVSYGPRLELFGRLNVPMDWDAIGLELEDSTDLFTGGVQ